jgi:uncharacterized membrane protein YkvA (DUF1232 family)
MTDYSGAYSEQAFQTKLNALGALKKIVEAAQKLHALIVDPRTPLWIKGMCIAALGYLILPTDAVADFIPVLGHGDDLAMLTAALTAIASRWQQNAPAVVAED